MTQLSDVSEAVGDAIESDDAPALPKSGEELGDFLGLEEEEQPEEGAGDEAGAEESESEQEEEPAVPAIEPPASWKKDDKEAFAALPPELQKVVSEREAQRETFVQAKAQEAANTRQTVENEARTVIAQLSQQAAQQLQHYAATFTPQEPVAEHYPDWVSYSQAKSQYDAVVAQRSQAQQQAAIYEDQARQQAQAIEQAETQAEVAALRSQFPEWYDPTGGPALQQELTAIAKEMGYSETHVSQARATDILAMRKASEWKAKADRWDAANKTKMEGVRAAKTLPKVAKPGVARTTDQNRQGKADAAWQRTLSARSKEEKTAGFADYLGLTGQI